MKKKIIAAVSIPLAAIAFGYYLSKDHLDSPRPSTAVQQTLQLRADPYLESFWDHYEETLVLLEKAQKEGIDLTKQYEEGGLAADVQYDIILNTYSLWKSVESDIRLSPLGSLLEQGAQANLQSNQGDIVEKIRGTYILARLKVENTLGDRNLQGMINYGLLILEASEKALGTHPFHHVIKGRQISIVNEATQAGYPVPVEFQKYIGWEIQSWESPSYSYNTLSDVPTDRPEVIPPEFRKMNKEAK